MSVVPKSGSVEGQFQHDTRIVQRKIGRGGMHWEITLFVWMDSIFPICTRIQTHKLHKHSHTHAHKRERTRARTHTYTHTHADLYINIHTHKMYVCVFVSKNLARICM